MSGNVNVMETIKSSKGIESNKRFWKKRYLNGIGYQVEEFSRKWEK